jgi:hypothetical protein
MTRLSTIAGAAIGAAGFVCLMGPVSAAELTGAEIKDLISGKSLYMEFSAASTGGVGKGVIYYAADGSALYKTAPGALWRGTWTIKDNTSCTDWKESPNNPCSKWDKQGDVLTQINIATGKSRGTLVKAVAGNSEKLAP